jgi:hypothetical protein
VQPSLGRAYTPEEIWRTGVGHRARPRVLAARLGGRSDVLDMTLTTDGSAARDRRDAAGFTVDGQKTDFLIPYNLTPEQMRAARAAADVRDRRACATASRSSRRTARCAGSTPSSRRRSRSAMPPAP